MKSSKFKISLPTKCGNPEISVTTGEVFEKGTGAIGMIDPAHRLVDKFKYSDILLINFLLSAGQQYNLFICIRILIFLFY